MSCLPTTTTMQRQHPLELRTPQYSHFSLAWSPFHEGRLAIASGANYGILGNGKLHIASVGPGPGGVPNLTMNKL